MAVVPLMTDRLMVQELKQLMSGAAEVRLVVGLWWLLAVAADVIGC
jgi:hypothetical protein